MPSRNSGVAQGRRPCASSTWEQAPIKACALMIIRAAESGKASRVRASASTCSMRHRKNGACEGIEVYREDFSQTTLEATRSQKFYLPKRFDIEDLQRCLLARARHA